MNESRKLASIQTVASVMPIEGADAIEQIVVLGWHLIAKKGEFKPGDNCVFFEIDSVLPEAEWSEFLRSKGFRVKTMKLNKFGVISQGLALPLSILPLEWIVANVDDLNSPHIAGVDVTQVLGVTQIEEDEITDLRQGGINLLPFPAGVPKTDEERIQSNPWILRRMEGQPWVATVKLDGTSMTAFYDSRENRLRVASRRCELEDDGNLYFGMAKHLELDRKLWSMADLVFQGELCGPGIQKNRLGLKEHHWFIYNVYDLRSGRYFGLYDIEHYCRLAGLETVPVHETGGSFNFTVDQLEHKALSAMYFQPGYMADGNLAPAAEAVMAEGLVFRPRYNQPDPVLGQLSFKVINKHYLLEYNL